MSKKLSNEALLYRAEKWLYRGVPLGSMLSLIPSFIGLFIFDLNEPVSWPFLVIPFFGLVIIFISLTITEICQRELQKEKFKNTAFKVSKISRAITRAAIFLLRLSKE